MIQNYNRYQILQEFFDFPRKEFHVRELSRKIKLAPVSVINHLAALQKEEFIIKEKRDLYATFRANRKSEDFKILKKQNLVWRMHTCGLLSFLDDKIKPNCIIVFGSASQGEDTELSDIDLFIQAKETDIEVQSYEKMLQRKINILFEQKITNLSKELLNNIINGQIVYGYFKVF